MEFVELVRERMDTMERERQGRRLSAEARRLGLTAPAWSPLAGVDRLLIRAAGRAEERQARREASTTNRTSLVS